ncbi:leucine-rich repeat-containing protein 3B isoform X2 [Rhineura floridana]|uniref:leucine-rich repeat-containing protein 3B isoform X2 n=1 Tax=Rhineura floridana TaxID=261503 RepID=UPI002AC84F1F|nr:leucine-rich repeat-containing protein 3B isoform X2 [Rhineura floridana]
MVRQAGRQAQDLGKDLSPIRYEMAPCDSFSKISFYLFGRKKEHPMRISSDRRLPDNLQRFSPKRQSYDKLECSFKKKTDHEEFYALTYP